MATINIRPTMLCPCGSRSVSVSCCYDKADGEFRKRIPSILPSAPTTGYAHPGCYLRGTNDCSRKISGEHYFSANILEQISKLSGMGGGTLRMSGLPWQAPEATQDLPITKLRANILCERHNNALAPLDQEAGRFFSILAQIEANEGRASRRPLIDLVSGTAIEQWMLKVACGLYYRA
ncbi:hypothetical protein [Bradyrhizobium pachyrhizi]|uniref:hypothetical protein n=1 Tax=Bradyrhizobium pachyrhizi TaxID=280333 RepID=UPI00128FC61B|nr:hypothetical protein [Bradyrhizobium pachyrhizi]